MVIYVLTAGHYSDYRIVAVSDDWQKAELLKKKLQPFTIDHIEIEEYETDEFADGINERPAYAIFFDKRGAAVGINRMDVWKAMNEIRDGFFNGIDVDAKRKVIRVMQVADNEEQAIKAAAEKRAQFMTERMEMLEAWGYFEEAEEDRTREEEP